MSYPTAADVTAKIVAQGQAAPADIESILSGVISDFERMTGYKPFLASETEAEFTFDAPGLVRDYVLDLSGAFMEISEIELNGSALTSTQYDLLPLNAEADGRGWTELRFRSHPGETLAGVVITGRRGLYDDLPADVFQAIANEAAGRGIVAASDGLSGAIEVKMGQMTVKQGEADSEGRTGFAKTAAATFERVIRKYKRVVI